MEYKKTFVEILCLTFLLILVMGFAGAYDNIGTYKQGKAINLNLGCSYNNTYCPSTFVCNVTVFNENGITITNQIMSTAYFPQYNYTISADFINKTGLYYGRQVCCGTVGCKDYSFEFNVNPQGKNYGSIEGIIYLTLLIILLVLFGTTLYGAIKIEHKNYTNSFGEYIKINWGKYLKIFLFVLAYLSFMGLTYFSWTISYGILEFQEMSKFFYSMFYFLYVMVLPIIAIAFVFSLIILVNDKNMDKKIKRGLTVK